MQKKQREMEKINKKKEKMLQYTLKQRYVYSIGAVRTKIDLSWIDISWIDLSWIDLSWIDLSWIDLRSISVHFEKVFTLI